MPQFNISVGIGEAVRVDSDRDEREVRLNAYLHLTKAGARLRLPGIRECYATFPEYKTEPLPAPLTTTLRLLEVRDKRWTARATASARLTRSYEDVFGARNKS